MPGKVLIRSHLRPGVHRFALEARQMFDGAAVAEAVAADTDRPAPAVEHAADAADVQNAAAHPVTVEAAAPAAHALYVIDRGVLDWQGLAAALPPGAEVLLIDSTSSGSRQLADALQGRHDITALHIVSHGTSGQFTLGKDTLTASNLIEFQRDWQSIGAALTADADILLYGCDVAQGGIAFVDSLASLTGADVSASIDPTGAASRGGNWTLEVQSGAIEATALAITGYEHLLVAPTITNTAPPDDVAVKVGENATATLIGGFITVTGTGADILEVTASVTKGTLDFASPPGGTTGNGTNTVVFTGNAAAVQAAINLLRYTYTGTLETGDTDTLNISINNTTSTGIGTLAGGRSIVIEPQNDAPIVLPPALITDPGILAVPEGGMTSFTAATTFGLAGVAQINLGLQDIDNTARQVIIKLTALPTQGALFLNGNELSIGSTFAVSDITNLQYRHNGAEVITNTLDTFTITVDDGAGSLVTNKVVGVKITPVNDAAVAGGTVTLIEGETGVQFTNAALPSPLAGLRGGLTITDPDQVAATYDVQITSVPLHGDLYYDGVLVTAGQTILLFDITKLTYDHDGLENTSDTFNIRVTDDGGGAAPITTADQTINLTILSNNDDPVLDVNTGLLFGTLQAITGNTVVITSAMLHVADVDSPTAQRTYSLTSIPNLATEGYLTHVDHPGQSLPIGFTFTQADVDAGKLGFVATTTSSFVTGFNFTVTDGAYRLFPAPNREGGIYADNVTTTLATSTFVIDYRGNATPGGAGTAPPPPNAAPVAGGTRFFDATQIAEGETITIGVTQLNYTDADNEDDELVYRLTSLPANGNILVNGVALGFNGSFTRANVVAGMVEYRHNGGEVFGSNFGFTVSDGNQVTAADVFSIDVLPQNDTPTAGNGTAIKLTEAGIFTITGAHIVLADADNAPGTGGYADTNLLSFKVMSLPATGTLRLNGIAVAVNDVISQADLLANLLTYEHSGAEIYADSFQIRPVDDQGILVAATPGGNPTNQVSEGLTLIVPIAINPLNDAPTFTSKFQPIAGESGPMQEGGIITIAGASGYTGGLGGVTGSGTPTVPAGLRLIYADSDNANDQRQYRITTAVANGSLTIAGRSLGVGSVFTQAELDANSIQYIHKGNETRNDFFEYVVSDGDYTSNDGTTNNGSAYAQGGPAAVPSRYSIEIAGANDKPAITAAANSLIVNSSITGVALPAVTLADFDLADGVSSGETDFVQVTVQFLDSTNVLYTNGRLDFGGATPGGLVITNAAGDNEVVFQGTLADVQAALNLITARTAGIDADLTNLKIRVTVDDRLRDGSGALSADANGGTFNVGGSTPGAGTAAFNTASVDITVLASDLNDPATVTVPGNITVNEDVRTLLDGADAISFSDPDAFGSTSNTITLTAVTGTLYFSASGTTSPPGLIVSGVGSNSVTLEGTKAAIQAALATLYYQSASNYHGDLGSDDTLTVTVNDGGNTGADGADGATPAPSVINIAINPVNDRPTLVMPTGTMTITANTSFVFTGLGKEITFDDAADISNASSPFTPGVDEYTITLNAQVAPSTNFGTINTPITTGLTVTAGTGNVILTGSRADLLAALAAVTYTPADWNNQTITFTVTVDDLDNGGTRLTDGVAGLQTRVGSFTLLATDINEAPGFTLLDATPSYTQGSSTGVQLDANATLVDPELDLFSNWSGSVMTLQRNGGANAGDVFGTTGSGGTGVNFDGSDIRIGTTVVGTFTNTGGTLEITFNAAANSANVDTVLQGITYRNTETSPAGTVTINYVINDQNTNVAGGGTPGSGQDQGSGGLLIGNGSITMTINRSVVAVNDSNTVAEGVTAASTSTATGDVTPGTLGQDSDPDADTITVQGVIAGVVGSVGAVGTTNVGSTIAGTYGTLNIAADGSYTYTLDNTNAAVQALATGDTLTDEFSYAINDSKVVLADRTSAFAKLTITINGTNDAPVLADTVLAIAQIEDAPAPLGAVGTLVSALTGGSTDLDTGAVKGIAVVGKDTSLGEWFYSTDNGATWTLMSAVSDTTALLLRDTDRVYFQPAPDALGAVPAALTLRTWDRTSGAAGTTVDVSINGTTTAFSTATDVVALTVTGDINDAPVIGGLDPLASGIFVRGGTATVIDSSITIADPELDVLGTRWQGATLNVQSQGGANADDVFETTGSGTSGVNFNGGNIRIGTTVVGTFTNAGGALTITFNNAAGTAEVQAVMQGISYRNSNVAAPDAVVLTFTIDDQNPTGPGITGSGVNQGTGGKLIDSKNVTINFNRPPLAANDGDTVLEGATISRGPGAGVIARNDTDPDPGPDVLTVTGVRTGSEAGTGTAGVVGVVLTGTYGRLTLNADGSYTYAANFLNTSATSVQDVFTYTIGDGNGGADVAELVIVINGITPMPAVSTGGGFFSYYGERNDPIIFGSYPPVIEQPMSPDLHVQLAVRDSMDAIREAGEMIDGVGPAFGNEIRSELLKIVQGMSHAEHVSRNGVAFSQRLIGDAQSRTRGIGNSLIVGAESLFNDFSQFNAFAVPAREAPADAVAAVDGDGASQAIAGAEPAQLVLPVPGAGAVPVMGAAAFSESITRVALERKLVREGQAGGPVPKSVRAVPLAAARA